MKRLLKIIGWSLLWLISFWAFLVITFPAEAAKNWLTNKLEKGLKAKASIEELSVRWNFGIRLKGISIISGQEGTVPDLRTERSEVVESGLSPKVTINLASLNIEPRLLSVIRFKPEIAFTGSPSSGGSFTGSYASEGLSLSFKDVLFKDFIIATLPLPSTAMLNGSGKLKLMSGKGAIEIQINGIPGGKQRIIIPGGEDRGMDGKFSVNISIPGI